MSESRPAVGPFLDLRLTRTRLVSETVTSQPSPASVKSGKPRQPNIQVNVASSSTFTVGIDDPQSPTRLSTAVEFKAEIKTADGERTLVTYDARHSCNFRIVRHSGITDWANLPEDVVGSALSTAYAMAVTRAEDTFAAMGMRNVQFKLEALFDELNGGAVERGPKAPRKPKAKARQRKVKP